MSAPGRRTLLRYSDERDSAPARSLPAGDDHTNARSMKSRPLASPQPWARRRSASASTGLRARRRELSPLDESRGPRVRRHRSGDTGASATVFRSTRSGVGRRLSARGRSRDPPPRATAARGARGVPEAPRGGVGVLSTRSVLCSADDLHLPHVETRVRSSSRSRGSASSTAIAARGSAGTSATPAPPKETWPRLRESRAPSQASRVLEGEILWVKARATLPRAGQKLPLRRGPLRSPRKARVFA